MSQRIMFEINGGLGLAGNMHHLAGKHKWNEWFKKKFSCKWKPIPYDDFEGWLRFWFGGIRRELGDNVELTFRIFTHLACWGIPASLYKNLASGGITAEVHQPGMNKLRKILTVCKELNAKLMITFLNNCSARDAGWNMNKYYSNDWWNKYHVPWITEITRQIKEWGYQDITTAELCNEGHGTVLWEQKGCEFLKELGYKETCTSSEVFDPRWLINNSNFDFVWSHGLWKSAKWGEYFNKYHSNPKVLPSTDGFSDLSGNWATRFYQFDQTRYGKLPTHQWVLKFMNALNGKSAAFNASGAIEKKEPNIIIINSWCHAIRDFKLTKEAFDVLD